MASLPPYFGQHIFIFPRLQVLTITWRGRIDGVNSPIFADCVRQDNSAVSLPTTEFKDLFSWNNASPSADEFLSMRDLGGLGF